MKRVSVAALCAAMVTLACAVLAAGASAETGGLGWGNDEFGQVGNGNHHSGSQVWSIGETTELSGATQISAGGDHSLALLSTGHVLAWGNGEYGQTGNGRAASHSLPVEVPSLKEVEAVAAGGSFNLALKGHKVYAWGRNNRGQVPIGFATGPQKCGEAIEGESKEHEQERACALEPIEVPGLEHVVAIAAGAEFGLALLEGGTVKSWGDNELGKLGTGSSVGPEKCGLAPDECSRKAVTVSGLSNVVAIAAGGTEAYALLESGEVVSWGANRSGQLGTGSFEGPEECAEPLAEKVPCSAKPVPVSGLSEVKAVSAGGEFGLALLNSGKVRSWGNNAKGQLGDGTMTNRSAPVAVLKAIEPPAELTGIVAISAGGKFSLALDEAGMPWVWGDNSEGALGAGFFFNTKIANKSPTGSVTAISAGERHSLVLGAPGPYIEGLTPNHGPSNEHTTVIIKGAGFTGVKKVEFNNTEIGFETLNEHEIRVVAPLGTPGNKGVTVTTTRAATASGPLAEFRYEPPGTIALGQCKKTTVGGGTKYKGGSCTEVLPTGNWEWFGSLPKPGFSAALSPEPPTPAVLLESTGGVAISCTGETGTGTWLNPKAAQNVVLKLTGCKGLFGECSSPGAAAGEIVTNPLEGALGFTDHLTNKVGLELLAEGVETAVIEAKCNTFNVKVTGAVIGQITSVNKMTGSFTLKLKQHHGEQVIESFEEEGATPQTLKMSLNGGEAVQTGLSVESTLTNEESIEINTVV
jgi:alpha-tubulin suppressor-like RCC1 family protein